MWKTWSWEMFGRKNIFRMLANVMQSDFSRHYTCERHEIRKKKCLWQNPHVFPWTKPSKRARARIRGPREVKACGFWNLKWLYVLCRLRVSTLLFKYRCCLSTPLGASEVSQSGLCVLAEHQRGSDINCVWGCMFLQARFRLLNVGCSHRGTFSAAFLALGTFPPSSSHDESKPKRFAPDLLWLQVWNTQASNN